MKPRSFPMTAVLLTVLALVTLLARADTIYAGTFNPNIGTVVDNPAAGVQSNITTQFNVGPELNCDDAEDGDGDGLINDGCRPEGDVAEGAVVGEAPESEAECENDIDDDDDGVINDGCPALCENDIDDDDDGLINDGCPSSKDVQFGAAISFLPSEWEVTPADEIPIGAVVGRVYSLSTLGIVNSQCDNYLEVEFIMLNASIDITDTMPYADSDDNGTEDAFEDKRPFGTAEAATANTLTDNAPDASPFDPGELEGFSIEIIGGTGAGQKLKIVSNTADTITVESNWDPAPDNTSQYEIRSGIKDSIEQYPEFISRIIGDVQPIRRAAGITRVAQADVLLQFLVFEPGTLLLRELPSDEELGYPSMTFLQDVGDPELIEEPNPLTDYCSPLAANVITLGVSKDNGCTDDVPSDELDSICEVGSALLLQCDNYLDDDGDQIVNDGCPTIGDKAESGAECENDTDDDADGWVNDGCAAIEEAEDSTPTKPDEGGIPLITNPEEGTYTFTTASQGQRDAENDGYENRLDTCPLVANVGSPRIRGDGDVDEDGLDAACDPDDMITNSDQDGDGYTNRQDNCPLVANGEDQTNQKDNDVNEQGEPRADGIGDACDPNPSVPDGEAIFAQASSEVTIGPGEGGAETNGEEGGGGGSAIIFIVIGVIAAVVVVGGGGFYLMRRGGT